MNAMEKKIIEAVNPGKYILAVSGGVDSVVLLDILSKKKNTELIIAHFDHGIRQDSKLDQQLVHDLAIKYDLDFITESVTLGLNASEQEAREARYNFLKSVVEKNNAHGIITAHHQDDLIETAVINLLRGTNRRGLTSLKSGPTVIRPMLGASKEQIRQYALEHQLIWREDSTNSDLKYKRNLIRSQLKASKDKTSIDMLLSEITKLGTTNNLIDESIGELIKDLSKGNKLNKSEFINLPHRIAMEVMAGWLRQNEILNYDATLLNNLVIASKTYQPGSLFSINKAAYLMTESEFLSIISSDH